MAIDPSDVINYSACCIHRTPYRVDPDVRYGTAAKRRWVKDKGAVDKLCFITVGELGSLVRAHGMRRISP